MLKGFFNYYDDNDPPQGGGEGGEHEGGKVRASDLRSQLGQVDEQTLMRVLERQAELLNDNHGYRKKIGKMQEVPKGSRVLTAEETQRLAAYEALGEPAALKQTLDGAQQAATDLATMKRDATLRDVRDVTGYDLDVLRDIGGADWQYTIKDETVDEKPAKVVYVKDGDQEARIDQHPKVVKFQASLKPQGVPLPNPGTPYPAQSGGQPPSGDMASRFLQQQAERRSTQNNPLMPKSTG